MCKTLRSLCRPRLFTEWVGVVKVSDVIHVLVKALAPFSLRFNGRYKRGEEQSEISPFPPPTDRPYDIVTLRHQPGFRS